MLATLWFSIAHYAIRPWRILTVLASLVLYPNLADKESGFVRTIVDPPYFPALAGLMIAAFAARTYVHRGHPAQLGCVVLVNDFYRRFVAKDRDDKHYVAAARSPRCSLMVASSVVTYYQDSIAGAWKFLMAIGAGTGSVFILRWFWWRINAWSEVAAMGTSFVVSLILQFRIEMEVGDPLVCLDRAGDRPVLQHRVAAGDLLTSPESPETLSDSTAAFSPVHALGVRWPGRPRCPAEAGRIQQPSRWFAGH